LLIIALTAAICSCQFTKTYVPDLNSKKDSVLALIKKTNGFADITLKAKSQSGSSGTHTTLVVKFINGNNVPVDSTGMAAPGKQLGKQITTILKNPKEFETYEILFSTITVKKGNFADVTNESDTGHDFTYSEL
jgi:hypothetical protein